MGKKATEFDAKKRKSEFASQAHDYGKYDLFYAIHIFAEVLQTWRLKTMIIYRKAIDGQLGCIFALMAIFAQKHNLQPASFFFFCDSFLSACHFLIHNL